MKKDKKEIILAKGIEISKSIFDSGNKREGKPLFRGGCLSFDIPEECNLIILCGNKGEGHQTSFRCLLPHQIYVDDLKEIFEKEHYEVITLFPVRSSENINVAYRDDDSKKRWEEK